MTLCERSGRDVPWFSSQFLLLTPVCTFHRAFRVFLFVSDLFIDNFLYVFQVLVLRRNFAEAHCCKLQVQVSALKAIGAPAR